MPMDTQRASLFFQLVSRRYETGLAVVTTNKPFDQWGQILVNDVIASAILDRLPHHSHIIDINRPSYRLKNTLKKEEVELSTGD